LKELKPQPWYQNKYLSSRADIVFGWGKAWAWKTYAIIMESTRHMTTIDWFGWVIFRRKTPMIVWEGGLRDTSVPIYSWLGARAKQSSLQRQFPPYKNKLKFSHMEYEKDMFNRQGTQIPFIWFDEVTQFTEKQFRYLVSRNRSVCWVKPYIRATCNPDPDSRVKEFISRWIDPETWYIIKERDWVVRYFIREQGEVLRWDTKEELLEKYPSVFAKYPEDKRIHLIKSFTFIEWDIFENKELMDKDPAYLANLMALDEQERSQLLDWNWNIKQDDTSLWDYKAIGDIFTNKIGLQEGYWITCDPARFGDNLCVIMVWKWMHVVKVIIYTKSSIEDIYMSIEREKEDYGIGSSKVIVDEWGLGWWLIDRWWYIWFNGWAAPEKIKQKDRNTLKSFRENYINLKTQCFYKLFKVINERKTTITKHNVRVDDKQTDEIKVGSKTVKIRDIIKKELRSIKKKRRSEDAKLWINSKDEQKAILGWRSPDFADTLMMRMYPEVWSKGPSVDILYLEL